MADPEIQRVPGPFTLDPFQSVVAFDFPAGDLYDSITVGYYLEDTDPGPGVVYGTKYGARITGIQRGDVGSDYPSGRPKLYNADGDLVYSETTQSSFPFNATNPPFTTWLGKCSAFPVPDGQTTFQYAETVANLTYSFTSTEVTRTDHPTTRVEVWNAADTEKLFTWFLGTACAITVSEDVSTPLPTIVLFDYTKT